MLSARFLVVLLVFASGCSAAPKPVRTPVENSFADRIDAVIEPSAAGWNVRLGPNNETVLVNPQGRAFNMGKTQYPDTIPTHLLKVRVDELKAQFLILHVGPAASAASILTVFTIMPNNVPLRAADIRHHWEWCMVGENDWKETLFVDSDGDGVPELHDHDIWKEGGTITYYSFDGKSFHPLWVEEYKADDDAKINLVSRRRVQ